MPGYFQARGLLVPDRSAVPLKAVIFDLFGTLVHNFDAGAGRRAQAEMAAILGVPLDDFARLWGGTSEARSRGGFASLEENIEHICSTLGSSASPERVRAAAQVRVRLIQGILKPRPGVLHTLSFLKESGYGIGLVSNSTPDVPPLWDETPLAPLFDVAVFSCLTGLRKPDPLIYRLACERLAVQPNECLYLADGEGGELGAARDLGMETVLLTTVGPRPLGANHPLYQEAREWQGPTVAAIPEVLALVRARADR